MFVMYFALWVIFNAAITLEIVIFGIVISALLVWFTCRFFDYSLKREKKIYLRIFLILKYVVNLVIEVVKCNLAVMHLILTQREEIKPMLVKFKTPLEKPDTQALMANTITLTPGTITVSLEEGEYIVHCLDEDFAEGIESAAFIDMIKKMEED